MSDDLRDRLTLLQSRMDHKADRLEVRDAVQSARDHADHGDERVKGEALNRIARIESAMQGVANELAGLKTSLGGTTATPVQTQAAWKDWRLLIGTGALIGYAIAHAPDGLKAIGSFMP